MPEDPLSEIRALVLGVREVVCEQLDLWRAKFEEYRPVVLELLEEADKGWTQTMLDTAEGLKTLASHGWYLSGSVGWDFPVRLARDEEVDWTQVDDGMSDLWRKELEASEASLTESHPSRAAVIRQAFEAHRNEMYSLSVLAFLSQADGICFDILGKQLYSKFRDGSAMTLSTAVSADGRMNVAYLAPLVTIQPIVWGPARRAREPGHLNRHSVLHGEDSEYGSELNSLKALSLLSYSSWALPLARDSEPEDSE